MNIDLSFALDVEIDEEGIVQAALEEARVEAITNKLTSFTYDKKSNFDWIQATPYFRDLARELLRTTGETK